MISWMSENAKEREWASDQSEAACASQARKDAEWMLSYDCLDMGTFGKAKYKG